MQIVHPLVMREIARQHEADLFGSARSARERRAPVATASTVSTRSRPRTLPRLRLALRAAQPPAAACCA